MLNATIAPPVCVFAIVSNDTDLHTALIALAVGIIHAAANEIRQFYKERKRKQRAKTKHNPTKPNG